VPVNVKLPKPTKVVAVSAGCEHSLALTSTGSVLAWGDGDDGDLGDGSFNESDVPMKVELAKGVKATAVAGGYTHSLALTSTGSVLAWGDNTFDELGDGTSGGDSDVPVQVELPAGTKATKSRTGSDAYHSLALMQRK
jgi:alpha-tubulin suppressor-like RCC1 family protein